MLHYNFPPFSVGETGRVGTGRREVGHGKLAWRAINSSLPEKEKFPYTIRVVSEITESNGSSSMATVCGASLALMDAAVPINETTAPIVRSLAVSVGTLRSFFIRIWNAPSKIIIATDIPTISFKAFPKDSGLRSPIP